MGRALVIGGNGFIGSHLVDRLVADGNDVTVFDRFSSATPTFNSTGARILTGDFLNRADLEHAVEDQQLVFHFLSTTTPLTAEEDPTLDLRTNVEQTVELLDACVNARIDRFVFASTGGAIYGSQGRASYSETDPTYPTSPYAIGKLAIENYLRYFRVKAGLESTVFRISNPYGTRQGANRKQGLIPIALRQIALGRPVQRVGDGSMVRDYLYVDDVTRMIATASSAPREDVYNIGSGVGFSVTEVFEAIERVVGRELVIEERAVPPTFVDRVVLDVSRFENEFGRQDLVTLDEGIRRTYEEIRNEFGE